MAKKYSAKERKAFHMGRAFAAGKDGGRVVCPDEQTKQSFRNGVKSARKKIGRHKNGVGYQQIDKNHCLEYDRKTGEVLRVVNCGGVNNG